jgi:chromosome segregation ATPase
MNNQRILIAAVAVLVIICGVLAYKLTQKTDVIEVIEEEKVALTDERDELLKDLEELQFSYDTLKTENEVMLAEIADQRDQIEKLMKRVRGKNGSLSKAKKEAETLRTIMKGYVATIDSLNQLNQQLMAEKRKVDEQIKTMKPSVANKDGTAKVVTQSNYLDNLARAESSNDPNARNP